VSEHRVTRVLPKLDLDAKRRRLRIGGDDCAALDADERQVALVRASLTTRRQDVPTRRRWA
jgi:hypothetical protein